MKNPLKLLSISLGLAAAVSGSALANQELAQLSANPNNWAMQAGDFANHRYSKLQQINATNVNKLQVAWMFSTGVLRGHEGSPLVIGDMMYLHTPFPNNVFAIELGTQKIKWKYAPKQDPAVIPQMCRDMVSAVWLCRWEPSCSRPTAPWSRRCYVLEKERGVCKRRS